MADRLIEILNKKQEHNGFKAFLIGYLQNNLLLQNDVYYITIRDHVCFGDKNSGRTFRNIACMIQELTEEIKHNIINVYDFRSLREFKIANIKINTPKFGIHFSFLSAIDLSFTWQFPYIRKLILNNVNGKNLVMYDIFVYDSTLLPQAIIASDNFPKITGINFSKVVFLANCSNIANRCDNLQYNETSSEDHCDIYKRCRSMTKSANFFTAC